MTYSYEEGLQEIKLPTLQTRSEREDLITIYKVVNHVEKLDGKDLMLLNQEDNGRTRGHSKKI